MMQLVTQPAGSRVCGQACLAMLLGCSLAEACELVGHRHGTRAPELARALEKAGRRAAGRLARWNGQLKALPALCVAKVTAVGRTKSHWVILDQGFVYDPSPAAPMWRLEEPPKGWKITSTMWVDHPLRKPRLRRARFIRRPRLIARPSSSS